MYSRLTCLIALAICLSFSKAYSQTDTSHYDLGRVKLDKKFTQSITLKGADLQRQPFANISDALNVWFYGTYTNSAYVIYVIDGNIINDVNAYNINDIEEITLVQNAVAQASGAPSQQQMILIKTKRSKPGKSGIEAAGQTNLINVRNMSNVKDINSPTNVYHQYYLSGYKNTDLVSTGISATYLRDVFPTLTTSQQAVIKTPLGFNRFKFNGYADVKLGSNNSLSATATYVPQVTRFDYDNSNIYNDPNTASRAQTITAYHAKQNLLNGGIRLNSQLAKGLKNNLSASYSYYNYNEDYNYNYYSSDLHSSTDAYSLHRRNVLLLRDNLSYQKTIGDFSIEPAIDFSYRYTRDSTAKATNNETSSGNAPSFPSTSTERTYAKRKDYLLTPSLGVSFKNSINLQGGFVTVLDSKKSLAIASNAELKRIFPYASASVNVSSLAGINIVGIKLYGSYSKQSILLQTDAEHLTGLSFDGPLQISLNSGGYPNFTYDPLKSYNVYTAGADVSVSALLSVNYNYERGGLQIPILYYLPYGANGSQSYIGYVDSKYTRNRIGITFRVVDKTDAHFTTGLNATNIKQRTNTITGNLATGDRVWTGGWVNRLDIDRVFAGMDVLYQLGGGGFANPYSSIDPILGPSDHSFSLQNVYFGYKLQINRFKNFEVFANGRNIWQNKKSEITDNRRFYGLGFKLGL
ncbi:hypothetical protein [Mucilaginibacter rubeus]|uniref:TonB-dependent receptor n=1 Tax=Mucilaginibacter rubeus TaxID=2027860 RepID=A0A5C1I3M4_9SPHI|nr:hypothetical protein [Mucilaginibacter rubeus]QEM12553.1 hypothetical protein DEO27_021910 [Mucilaginibacter rubeus]